MLVIPPFFVALLDRRVGVIVVRRRAFGASLPARAEARWPSIGTQYPYLACSIASGWAMVVAVGRLVSSSGNSEVQALVTFEARL